ncbi:MAG: hypothetical protein MHM6MM_002808 [Cercozoa sp. M6MM]
MFVQEFEFDVRHRLSKKRVAVGRFLHAHCETLCFASEEGSVVLFDALSADKKQRFQHIPVGQQVHTLAAAGFRRAEVGVLTSYDSLLIGSESLLRAHNVLQNADDFAVQCTDGVQDLLALRPLRPRNTSDSVAFVCVAGHSTVQVLDQHGSELSWNIVGEAVAQVTAMSAEHSARRNFDLQSHPIVVGCRDTSLHMLQKDMLLWESKEAAPIVSVCAAFSSRSAWKNHDFGDVCVLGLSNGSVVGITSGRHKLWQKVGTNVKTPESIAAFEETVVVAYSNGEVEALNTGSGVVVWKQHFASPVVAVFAANLTAAASDLTVPVTNKHVVELRTAQRPSTGEIDFEINEKTNSLQLILCCESGAVFGLLECSALRKEVSALRQRKRLLKQQLSELQRNEEQAKMQSPKTANPASAPPLGTEIACTLSPRKIECDAITQIQLDEVKEKGHTENSWGLSEQYHGCLELQMVTNNAALIKLVVVFSDNLQNSASSNTNEPGHSLVFRPQQPSSKVTVPLQLARDEACNLQFKILVGFSSSSHDHLFEMSHRVPRFASYLYVRPKSLPAEILPTEAVTLPVSERMGRIVLWLNRAFLIDFEQRNARKTMTLGFRSLRNPRCLLLINVVPEEGVKDLSQALQLGAINGTATLPATCRLLRQLLDSVAERRDALARSCVDTADTIARLKTQVLRAEDARMLRDWRRMAARISDSASIHKELCSSHAMRRHNRQAATDDLRRVHRQLAHVSSLRTGHFRSAVLGVAREHVRNALRAGACCDEDFAVLAMALESGVT